MKTAAIYDIHGNLPALEAVLTEIHEAGVDNLVVGGDVLPGPMPREALNALLSVRQIPVRFIRGNGEAAVLAEWAGRPSGVPDEYRDAVRWTAQQVLPEFENFLLSWAATVRLTIQGLGQVLFCHATPRSDTEIFTSSTQESVLTPIFDPLEVDFVVCGHTHMQFDRFIGSTRVINAGSVGMPFGNPGAYWLLIGDTLELRHTSYDLSDAAARIEATSYPQRRDYAHNHVLRCPTEAEMLEAFSKAQLR